MSMESDNESVAEDSSDDESVPLDGGEGGFDARGIIVDEVERRPDFDFDDDDDDDDDMPEFGAFIPHFDGELHSDEEEEEEATTDENGVVIHHGVSCDECGTSPIRGTIYHSTRLIDYDICEECYEQNHKHLTLADAFLVLKGRHSRVNDEEYFEDPESMRVDCWGWEDMRHELEQNERLQNLDVNFNMFEEEVMELPAEEDIKAIKSLVANSTNLKVFYGDFPQRELEANTQPITTLLEGLSASQSILTLSISLNFAWSSAIEDICNVIRNNKSIRYMFLRHRPHKLTATEQLEEAVRLTDFTQEEREQYSRTQEQEQVERENRAKASVVLLFQALAEGASMHSFFCDGITELGEDCRAAAIAAMRDRPSLKRIKANFEVQNEELEQLMQDKKENWMRNWNDVDASNESRVQILEELLSCKQVEEVDQVAALFHFVRSNPGSLPELDVGSDESDSKRMRLS